MHGLNTRLSTIVTGDVPRGSDFTRKIEGPVSDEIGGQKRTTGDAGIATNGVSLGCSLSLWHSIAITLEIEDSISHLASLSSSRLGCDSRRFIQKLLG